MATPLPLFACTNESKSDLDTPTTTQKDRIQNLKLQSYTNFKGQKLLSESNTNIQEEQSTHNSVQIKCPVKLNRAERNSHNLGYGHNDIVHARSESNPLYSTLVPFTPK